MASCIDVIRGHVSIRRYKRVPVPEEHVALMMEAARRAPTDAALHLWSAVRVRDPGVRARIAEEIRQPHVAEAAEFFVFLADLYRLERLLEHRDHRLGCVHRALLLFAAVDAGIAAENLAIAAESLGYGTCFIGAVWNKPRLIIRLLDLPRLTLPLFGLTVGVPDESPERRPRLPTRLLFHVDRYRRPAPGDLDEAYRVMAPITRRRDYLRLLLRYAGPGGYFESRDSELPAILEEQGFTSCSGTAAGR